MIVTRALGTLLLWCCLAEGFEVGSFSFSTSRCVSVSKYSSSRGAITVAPATALYASQKNDNEKSEYSRELYLREEAESPFRKVRFFFYIALGGGALTSLAVSGARAAAALSGINTDLLQESLINVAVDISGLALIGFLYQRDLRAQESRLKRASKGADLARLMVRGSKSIILGEVTESNDKTFTTSLASLRRGRGIEKRVVIAAAGAKMIEQVLQDAIRLQESLSQNDLLVVPVIMPSGKAPNTDRINNLPNCIALPAGNNWRSVVEDEAQEAVKQGIDILEEGFCIILKKNGRVGQRTRGVFLDKMVSDVVSRNDAGLDIKNI